MSSCPRPPGPLLVTNDEGGERCRFKAQLSVFCLLCLPESGGTGLQISVAPVSICLSLSISSVRQTRWHRVSKSGGTGFGCWMQQAHVINSL
jgi:hypothetical protein